MERNTLAIVIRTVDYKDNDRMLTLLTRDYGRMSAKIRGAKKPASKLFAAASLFCCGEYSFYEKHARYGVKSCTIRKTFFNLQSDYDAYAAACFIADAVDKVAQEDDDASSLFVLTANALYALDTGLASTALVLCYFLQRLLYIEGVYPSLGACAHCGAQQGLVRFSAQHGGVLCGACAAGGGTDINPAFLDALRRLAHTSSKDLNTLSMDEDVLKKLSKALIEYLEYMLARPLKTSKFIQSHGEKHADSADDNSEKNTVKIN